MEGQLRERKTPSPRKILIVAATADEIADTLAFLDNASDKPGAVVETLITGVGMTATAYHLGLKLASSGPFDLIVNAGIAGSFDRSLPPGTVVNVTEDTFAELGAEDGDSFLPIEDLGFSESTFYSHFTESDPLVEALPARKGITVNRVHGNDKSIRLIRERFGDAGIESMEGAAVFYAAAQSGIPVIQIRGVSNYVEPRNRAAWEIGPAITALNSWLIHFIESKIP